jgi:hypothetical protein
VRLAHTAGRSNAGLVVDAAQNRMGELQCCQRLRCGGAYLRTLSFSELQRPPLVPSTLLANSKWMLPPLWTTGSEGETPWPTWNWVTHNTAQC